MLKRSYYHGQIFNAPWFENLAKRQIKSPKIYFRDGGLLHTILSIALKSAE